MNAIRLDRLPSENGFLLTRESIVGAIHPKARQWLLEKRQFTGFYSGGREGNDPIFMEAATQIARTFNKNGEVCVNGGGGTQGCMKAVIDQFERAIGVTTSLFAKKSTGGHAGNEGLAQFAINAIMQDFYDRREVLKWLPHSFIVLMGGLGTLDESSGTVIFSAGKKRPNIFSNLKGCWDNLQRFYNKLADFGLMPNTYMSNVYFPETIDETIRLKRQLCNNTNYDRPLEKHLFNSSVGLSEYVSRNPEKLDALFRDISDFTDGSPRIGVIASKNIGPEKGHFNFESRFKRDEISAAAAQIGQQLGKQGALAIIVGDNKGLRKIIADNHIKNGGRIIWVQTGNTGNVPFRFFQKDNPLERKLVVPFHFEVDLFSDHLSQSHICISGGIHTFNRVMESVTRAQTGHLCSLTLTPECFDERDPRQKTFIVDTTLGNGETLWAPLRSQIETCVETGFIPKTDDGILKFSEDVAAPVKQAISAARRQPDLIARRLALKY